MRDALWRSLWLGMALLAMALSGCGAAPHVKGPAATATATPLASLTWTPVKLPTAFTPSGENLTVSLVDGHVAWMCQSTSETTYVVWKTTDAGQSWRQTGGFSFKAPMVGAFCRLNSDQNGTDSLMATMTWGCGECGTLADASLFSADGATHWTPLSVHVMSGEFATVRGGVIAVVAKAPITSETTPQDLAFSSDGFQTWRAMSAQGLPTTFFQFAVSPDSATLIGSGYNNTVWRSNDLGAHWTQLSSPHGQTGRAIWLPQRSTFLLCGGDLSVNNFLECSTDYGAHWSQTPILTYTEPCPVPGKCGKGVTMQTHQCIPFLNESDGTMLSECLPNQTAPLPASGPSFTIVYVLPLGTATWRPIGTTQCRISVVPATGPDWCANTAPDQLLGYSTGQLPG